MGKRCIVGSVYSFGDEHLFVPLDENKMCLLIPCFGWLIPRNCYVAKKNAKKHKEVIINTRKKKIAIISVPLGIMVAKMLNNMDLQIIISLSATEAIILYISFTILAYLLSFLIMDLFAPKQRIDLSVNFDLVQKVNLRIQSIKSIFILLFLLYLQFQVALMGIDTLKGLTVIGIIKLLISLIIVVMINFASCMIYSIEINGKTFVGELAKIMRLVN